MDISMIYVSVYGLEFFFFFFCVIVMWCQFGKVLNTKLDYRSSYFCILRKLLWFVWIEGEEGGVE